MNPVLWGDLSCPSDCALIWSAKISGISVLQSLVCFAITRKACSESVLNTQRLKQLIHLAIAVRELVEVDAGFVEQRQVKIRQRRRLCVFDVAVAFHSRRGAADD